jgi:polyisoprenyl-phosphate glycosyltransferase
MRLAVPATTDAIDRYLIDAPANDTPRPRSAVEGKRSVTLVVPVFNEEKGLSSLVQRIERVMGQLDVVWDVLFVDDGSRDGTLAVLRSIHGRDARYRAISFSRNFGKEIAIAAGLEHVTADAAVLMDADLQHPPELIGAFVDTWRAGHDIVYGQRRDREADSLARRLFAKVYYRMFRALSGTSLPKGAGDFRLLDRKAVAAMNRFGERVRFNKGLYSWIGFDAVGVPFDVPARADGGHSRWGLRKLLHFALDGVTSFSTIPLRIWTYVGVGVSILSFIYAAQAFARTLLFGRDPVAPGFPTLAISVMFLAGVQLVSLGIIGEYIGRIYEEIKGRPMYIVRESLGVDPPDVATRDSGRRVSVA